MRVAPLSLPLQCACFVAYLVVLLVLPHEFGMTGLRDKHAIWKGARLGLVLLAWLPLVWLIVRRQPASAWRWAILGGWVPLAFTLGAFGTLLGEWSMTLERARSLEGTSASVSWYDVRSTFSYTATAATYAWLTCSYASVAKRWWGALLIGSAAFGLMLVVDVVVLASVTGPHKLH